MFPLIMMSAEKLFIFILPTNDALRIYKIYSYYLYGICVCCVAFSLCITVALTKIRKKVRLSAGKMVSYKILVR